jgi:hypothetical protein
MREEACDKDLDCTQLLVNAVDKLDEEDVDRVAIVSLDKDGSTIRLRSNARSSAELYGMLNLALTMYEAD